MDYQQGILLNVSIGIALPDTPLYDALKILALESDYLRVRINEQPLDWLEKNHPNANLSIGTGSLTDTSNRVKYLYQWPYTYGELSAHYLNMCIPKDLPLAGYRKLPRAPVWFRGPTAGYMAYVDIRSCYFALYSVLNVDFQYGPNTFNWGTLPFLYTDELLLCKSIRNSVFGIMRRSNKDSFNRGKFNRTTNTRSPYYRPDLAHYVLDTIQAIAQEAYELFDIKQWLTDAAILPYNQAKEFIMWLDLEWGLQSRIDASGMSYSIAMNRYRVGDKMTRSFEHLDVSPRPISTLTPVNRDRLKAIRKEILATATVQI